VGAVSPVRVSIVPIHFAYQSECVNHRLQERHWVSVHWWRQDGQTPPVSKVFHSFPHVQNHLSSLRGNQPQAGSGCERVLTRRVSSRSLDLQDRPKPAAPLQDPSLPHSTDLQHRVALRNQKPRKHSQPKAVRLDRLRNTPSDKVRRTGVCNKSSAQIACRVVKHVRLDPQRSRRPRHSREPVKRGAGLPNPVRISAVGRDVHLDHH
jgi:hypothetical protein